MILTTAHRHRPRRFGSVPITAIAAPLALGALFEVMTISSAVRGVAQPLSLAAAALDMVTHPVDLFGFHAAHIEAQLTRAGGIDGVSIVGALALGLLVFCLVLEGALVGLWALIKLAPAVDRFAAGRARWSRPRRAALRVLDGFVPPLDGHALIVGDGRTALADWCHDRLPAGDDLVILGPALKGLAGPHVTSVRSPSLWEEILETVLSETARRYSPGPHVLIPRRIFVVVDLGALLSPNQVPLTGGARDRVLERVDELVRIGPAAAVHVLAFATEPDTLRNVSATVRDNSHLFHFPRPVTAGAVAEPNQSA